MERKGSTMGITYHQDAEGRYWATVPDGYEVREGYEVAAWYDILRLQGGTYEVHPKMNDGRIGVPASDPKPGQRPYWACYSVPAVKTFQHTPSLFGGVQVGPGNGGERNEATTHHVSLYFFQLEKALMEGVAK